MKTQSIRYTGSKNKIIPKILDMIKLLQVETILDGMSGTTRVSQALKKSGYTVCANDIAYYAQVLGNCYIKNDRPPEYYKKMIKHLNNIKGVNGWFTETYGGIVTDNKDTNAIQSDGKKRIWQVHNTMKLDAIRNEIDSISNDDIEKSVLLTSLMLALDAVDNTLGHQVSYLKKWSGRSYDTIQLKVPELIIDNTNKHTVTRKNIFDITDKYDLVYLDPPYGTSNKQTPTTRVRYASYYHLWTTVCLNDKPDVVGAANRRYDASSDLLPDAISVFEHTKEQIVTDAIIVLLEQLDTKYILFSYSNKSRVPYDSLIEIFNRWRIIDIQEFSHKQNIMKSLVKHRKYLNDDGKENKEFLFLIEK